MKITFALLCLFFAAAPTSCGGPQTGTGSGSGTTVGDVVTSCATVDIGKTVPEIGMTIFQDVSTIVQAGSSGWEAALENIGVKYGYDALTCALQAAYNKLTAHPAGTMAPPTPDSAKRAQTFMASHHLKAAP
jgi:hypothetical protein